MMIDVMSYHMDRMIPAREDNLKCKSGVSNHNNIDPGKPAAEVSQT